MAQEDIKAEAVTLLQDLGLKEYEARCFLGLTQLSKGTAKEISDISEVPRTRVYDSIRVLESKGLVQVQHGNPQQYRAVSVEEAAQVLRQQFDDRIDTLQSQLEVLDKAPDPDDAERKQEVWALTGPESIHSRMLSLLEEADSEIVLLVVEEDLLTEELFDRLHEAVDRGVDVVLGGKTPSIVSELEAELPSVAVFETDLGWLMGPTDDDEVAISRLLLVDRTTLLVSSFYPEGEHEPQEQAIYANGLENGLVVLIRRLISSGRLSVTNPG